jgi:two-component sensor histidine kinase
VVKVALRSDAEHDWILVVQDNGIGLPNDLDIGQTHSLGLTLVHELASQLRGTVQVDRLQGTTFTIRFRSIQPGGA